MSPDTLDGLASRMRKMELEHVRLSGDISSIKDDVRELKDNSKEAAQKVDERLGGISKLLWGAVSLLFTAFIAALGILVSQGGIH
jgi:hypothetical protein